jgi:hypothetical protein
MTGHFYNVLTVTPMDLYIDVYKMHGTRHQIIPLFPELILNYMTNDRLMHKARYQTFPWLPASTLKIKE